MELFIIACTLFAGILVLGRIAIILARGVIAREANYSFDYKPWKLAHVSRKTYMRGYWSL